MEMDMGTREKLGLDLVVPWYCGWRRNEKRDGARVEEANSCARVQMGVAPHRSWGCASLENQFDWLLRYACCTALIRG